MVNLALLGVILLMAYNLWIAIYVFRNYESRIEKLESQMKRMKK